MHHTATPIHTAGSSASATNPIHHGSMSPRMTVATDEGSGMSEQDNGDENDGQDAEDGPDTEQVEEKHMVETQETRTVTSDE
jgi:hypothetical protein